MDNQGGGDRIDHLTSPVGRRKYDEWGDGRHAVPQDARAPTAQDVLTTVKLTDGQGADPPDGGAHDVPSHGDVLGSVGPEAYVNKPAPGDAVASRVDYKPSGAASRRTANALDGATSHDNANVPSSATSERVTDTLGGAASVLIAAGGLVTHGAVVNCAAGQCWLQL